MNTFNNQDNYNNTYELIVIAVGDDGIVDLSDYLKKVIIHFDTNVTRQTQCTLVFDHNLQLIDRMQCTKITFKINKIESGGAKVEIFNADFRLTYVTIKKGDIHAQIDRIRKLRWTTYSNFNIIAGNQCTVDGDIPDTDVTDTCNCYNNPGTYETWAPMDNLYWYIQAFDKVWGYKDENKPTCLYLNNSTNATSYEMYYKPLMPVGKSWDVITNYGKVAPYLLAPYYLYINEFNFSEIIKSGGSIKQCDENASYVNDHFSIDLIDLYYRSDSTIRTLELDMLNTSHTPLKTGYTNFIPCKNLLDKIENEFIGIQMPGYTTRFPAKYDDSKNVLSKDKNHVFKLSFDSDFIEVIRTIYAKYFYRQAVKLNFYKITDFDIRAKMLGKIISFGADKELNEMPVEMITTFSKLRDHQNGFSVFTVESDLTVLAQMKPDADFEADRNNELNNAAEYVSKYFVAPQKTYTQG